MEEKSIQPPSKKKVKESVPFMNGSYDFSTVATNGEPTYDDREIKVVFGIPPDSSLHLKTIYSRALEWLMDSGKAQIIFDDGEDSYYMGEVESAPTFEELQEYGKLSVTFIAEPFRKSVDYVGSNIWDTFNFEEDYLQSIEFDVVNSKVVTIYNPGRIVSPIINCNANMTVLTNGLTANLVSGDNKKWTFKLQPGRNDIMITGTGHIKFIFRKELL